MDIHQHLSLQPLRNSSSGRVIYRHFSDIDEFATFLPEDVRLTQLHGQPFSCHSMALCFETIRFNFNQVNCRLYAVGNKCSGFLTFTFLLHGQGQPVISNHLPITEDYVWGFNPNREADLVFPGNSTHCAVHVRQDVFDDCAQALDRSDLNAQFLVPNHVYSPETLPSLRAYLDRVYALLSQRSPLLHQLDFQQLILQDFLPLLITALPVQQERLKKTAKAFRRSRLVRQANEYIQTHLDQALTLTSLCQALGTSSRTLCYGFQEMFGISPMAYLKILRLQGVYRILKAADPDATTIAETASQFGFWHLGYFARDYKQMFGELPSETLKR